MKRRRVKILAGRTRFRYRSGLVLRSSMLGDRMVKAGLVAREALRCSDSCVSVDFTHKKGPEIIPNWD